MKLAKKRLITWFTALVTTSMNSAPAQDATVKVESGGRNYIGQPLAFDGNNLVMKRRDGRISVIGVANERAIKPVNDHFEPYTPSVMRESLQKEFRQKYQVSVTQNFVVVHPPGDYQNWATPFEVLYQRFRTYFTSRGFAVDEPEFPLVAVVLRSRSEFDKFLRAWHQYDANILGYYSQKSNRIVTFDPTGGRGAKSDWAFHATLIHEAVHQTAFNVGVHQRFGGTPSWVLEGLACMFEASGVHNSLRYSEQSERINKNRLSQLQHFYRQNRVQGKLKAFVAHDRHFDSDPAVAYAYSWGLTFFLAEMFPAKYFQFLREDASRDGFREFTAAQRVAAFQLAFGDDLDGLEKRLERFILDLR